MCTNKSVPAKQTKTLDPFQSWNQLLKNVPLSSSHTPGSTFEQSSTVIKRKSSKGRNSFNVSIQRSFGHVQHNHMGCKGKHATAQWYKKQFCKQIHMGQTSFNLNFHTNRLLLWLWKPLQGQDIWDLYYSENFCYLPSWHLIDCSCFFLSRC